MRRRIAQIFIASAAIVTFSATGSAIWFAFQGGPAPAVIEAADR